MQCFRVLSRGQVGCLQSLREGGCNLGTQQGRRGRTYPGLAGPPAKGTPDTRRTFSVINTYKPFLHSESGRLLGDRGPPFPPICPIWMQISSEEAGLREPIGSLRDGKEARCSFYIWRELVQPGNAVSASHGCCVGRLREPLFLNYLLTCSAGGPPI